MSNILDQNPYIVDTAMSASLKNTAGAYPNSESFRISQVTWLGSSSGTLVIVDGFGATIVSLADTGSPQVVNLNIQVSDFRVTTITSGTAYIYTGQIVTSTNGGTVTNLSGALTVNKVMIGNGTNDSKVLAALGTSGFVLTSQGAALPPVFAILPASASGSAPANAGSTGTAGTIAYDATHIYVCIATDTWVRATLATWP